MSNTIGPARCTLISGRRQLGQQLRVVDHTVIAAVLAVFLAQCVETVGTGGDDAPLLVAHHFVEHLDVALRQLEEEGLVARPAGRVTGAAHAPSRREWHSSRRRR